MKDLFLQAYSNGVRKQASRSTYLVKYISLWYRFIKKRPFNDSFTSYLFKDKLANKEDYTTKKTSLPQGNQSNVLVTLYNCA